METTVTIPSTPSAAADSAPRIKPVALSDHRNIARYYIELVRERGFEEEFALKRLAKGEIYRADLLLHFDRNDPAWRPFFIDPESKVLVFRPDAVKAIGASSIARDKRAALMSLYKQSKKGMEAAGRAHSYIYASLEYLRRKRGDLVYQEALDTLGFTRRHLDIMRKHINQKNSYLLEQATIHMLLSYFSDLPFGQKQKIIESITEQTSSMELLPNKKGLLERRIVPMFIITKMIGKFSRNNSTLSYGISSNMKNGREVKGLTGIFRRKQEMTGSYIYYNTPCVDQPWLRRPEMITANGVEYHPSRETVRHIGLIDYYTVLAAISASIGVALFKDITVGLRWEILEYPLCIDQWETFIDGKRYRMRDDGAFSEVGSPDSIAVDSFGKTVTYFDTARFALDASDNVIYGLRDETRKNDPRVARIIVINSDRVRFHLFYERRYKYGKFKIDIARELGTEPEKLRFAGDVLPAILRRRFGTLSALALVALVYAGLRLNAPLRPIAIGSALFGLIIGRIADFIQKSGIRKERYYQKEIEDDRERDRIGQENQLKLYNRLLETSRRMTEEQQKLDSILNSLTSGIVTIDRDENVIDANASFCRYTGIAREELLGKPCASLFHPDDYRLVLEIVNDVITAKKGKYKELVLAHISEGNTYLKTIVSPIFNDAGDVMSVSINFEDRTKQRVAELTHREQLTKESRINQQILMTVSEANPLIDEIIRDSRDFSEKLLHISGIIKENKAYSRELAESLSAIEKMSSELITFINLIVDISDRTNLISLNAAIEAARAGESGKAFSVVAGEISKLADQSRKGSEDQQRVIEKVIELIKALQERYDSFNERFVKLTGLVADLVTRTGENQTRAGKAQEAMSEIKGAIRSSIGI